MGDDAYRIDSCQYVEVSPIAATTSACPPLLTSALDPQQAQELSLAFKALADPARLRLLSLIQAQPGSEACVCHLTAPLGLSQPTVSHHMKVLLDAGIVSREQRGSWAFYRVEADALGSLRALLS